MMRIVRHEPPESEASTKLPRSFHEAPTRPLPPTTGPRARAPTTAPSLHRAYTPTMAPPPSLMADVWPLALAVIFGTTVDESYGDEMAVTVVATSFDSTEARARLTNPA